MTSRANPTPDRPGHLFCFGLGYSAARLGRRLLAAGWTVSGTTRRADKVAALAAQGFRAYRFDGEAAVPADALVGVTHLLASIPPGEEGDPALERHRAVLRALPLLSWVGYLSTPAVYGDRGGAWIDEEAPLRPGSARGRRRLAAERAWAACFADRPAAVQIFRLAGIYGPGRSVIDQLRAGTARIIDKPGQVFNRIHVADIATVLLAAMARPRDGGIYNLADREPCCSGTVVRHAAALLGVAPPAPTPFAAAALSPMARGFYAECKRLDTGRLCRELGVRLACPSYREGLAAILAEQGE